MKKKNSGKEKRYRSTDEFERKFFPNSYSRRIEEERGKDPETLGIDLAMTFIEDVKRKLAR